MTTDCQGCFIMDTCNYYTITLLYLYIHTYNLKENGTTIGSTSYYILFSSLSILKTLRFTTSEIHIIRYCKTVKSIF